MKLVYVFLLLAGFFSFGTQCDSELTVSPREAYIAQASKEWADSYLPTLDAYQTQLLASNLNILCDQAYQTANVETSRHAILYRTRELIDAHKIIAMQTIPDMCTEYGTLFYQLHTITSNLEQCTKLIDELEDGYGEPLRKALDAVAAIGRQATTFHDQALEAHTQSVLRVLEKIIAQLDDQHATVQRVGEIEQAQHTILAQFYTMHTISEKMTHKAWQLIALQLVNELTNIELMRTCAAVFEACFEPTNAKLNNPEVPESYRTLLFLE